MAATTFTGELIGTFILILLGVGVNAGNSLNKSYAQNGGWINIATGWGFAVTMGIFVSQKFGSEGAHLNPAVTIAVSIVNGDYSEMMSFILAQLIGAILGATTVWLMYLPHWKVTEDATTKRGVFCTSPAIKNTVANVFSEAIGTFALIVGVLCIYTEVEGGLKPLLVGILVWSIGLSLGGTTGYAINPARDLGPRIAHFILPIAGKGDSNWSYAWIPVVGPALGAVLGALLLLVFSVA